MCHEYFWWLYFCYFFYSKRTNSRVVYVLFFLLISTSTCVASDMAECDVLPVGNHMIALFRHQFIATLLYSAIRRCSFHTVLVRWYMSDQVFVSHTLYCWQYLGVVCFGLLAVGGNLGTGTVDGAYWYLPMLYEDYYYYYYSVFLILVSTNTLCIICPKICCTLFIRF